MYLSVYHYFEYIKSSTCIRYLIIQGLKTSIKCFYYFFIPFGIKNTTYLCIINFKL